MDFIERLLGVSPDGGSGALELALFVAPLVMLAIARALARRRAGRVD
jgi:hypothetical protein